MNNLKIRYNEWMKRPTDFYTMYFGTEECDRWDNETGFQDLVQEARLHEGPEFDEWIKKHMNIDAKKLKTYGFVDDELKDYYIQHKDMHDLLNHTPYDPMKYRYAVECIGNMILNGDITLN